MHHTQACILTSVHKGSPVQGLEHRRMYVPVCDISCGSPLDQFQLNMYVGLGIWIPYGVCVVYQGGGLELNMPAALLT